MNKIYKVIWSKVRNCYVAVSEIAKCNGKSCTSVNCGAKANSRSVGVALSAAVGVTLLAGVCSVLLPVRIALAAPPVMPTLDVNGKSDAVTIASTSSATSATMNINSTQTNNVLKWIDFSIGKDGAVNFTDSHNYLNYVTGHGRSEIDGTLTGAGNIYLINPNGILFGSTAQVNVGNLYLSTRKIDDDTLATFDNNNSTAMNPLGTTATSAAGDIVNLGTLNATKITVEGNNVSFKNAADVNATGADNINVLASGEVHVGYAASDEVNEVIDTEYTAGHINPLDLSKWSFKKLDNSTVVEPTKYMLVRNAYELQNMQNNLTGNYMLANDIEFKKADNSLYIEHFQPIGRKPGPNVPEEGMFQGRLDGLNHVISDIKIDSIFTGSGNGDVGIIGSNAGVVENLGVVNGNINAPGYSWVGGIVGANKTGGIIRNVYFTGSVTGAWGVGGIAGGQNAGYLSLPSASIEKAYNAGTINGVNNSDTRVGGIVGSNSGAVKEAYNTGTVNSTNGEYIGGIVGRNFSSDIENVYNTGDISGAKNIGGIVGYHQAGTIKFTYNTGDISGTNNIGIGGIVGVREGGSVVSSYSTVGNVPGELISESDLKKFDTFAKSDLADNIRWDMSKTGGAGTVWRIYEGQTAPLLTAFLNTKDYINKKTYDGTADFGDYKDVGTYKNVSGTTPVTTHVSTQAEGFGFDYVQDVSVIEPKELTVSFADISKTYDGNATATPGDGTLSTADIISGDEDKVTLVTSHISALYEDKNAGSNKTVNYSGIALGGTSAGNYSIAATAEGKGTISAKELSLANVSKTYDGTANVEAGDIALATDIIEGDDAIFDSSKISGVYVNKNAGESKAVTYTVNTGALTGTDAGNYSILTAGTGDITKADLTLTAENVTKTYDGTTSVTSGTLKVKSGTLYTEQGDSMSGGTFAFTNKNAGTGNKVVTVTDATISDGNGGENYNVKYENNTTSTIMTKALSVGNVTKEYDGNATASLTVSNLLGVEECDETGLSISAGVVANYTNNTGDKDANAGTGKRVEYTGLTLSGAEAGNYTIDASGTSTTGNSITARPLTMGSVSKVYDGTDNALVSVYALTNAIEDDLLDLSFKGTSSGKYNSGKNVGDNLTVTYTGLILEGAKAGNYTIDSDAVVTGNSITPKELTLVADKVTIKSGETVPPFTGNIIGFVEGEGLASEVDLRFALAGTEPTMAGSYAIVGKLKDSASGNYQENGVYKAKDNTFANYTFSNAPANEKAFTIAVDVMPQLDFRGASADVTIDSTTIANTMAISSIKSNNVLKWIDFSIGSGGTVQFDAKNYLNYVTGHGRSEIYGTLTGGGDIYLINPNGMLFGSTAQVNVGNLYLSTRSFDVDDELDDKLNDYLNNRTIPTGSTILGDVTNLGKLNTNGVVNPNTNVLKNTIEVEGKNISIKNIADVTTGGTLTNGTLSGGSMHNNVKLTSGDGEIHLGFAVSDTPAEGVNDTQYTNVTPPSLEGWTTTGTTHKYMLVHNAYELQNINNNLTGNYMLANDIDFIDENGDWIIRDFKSLGSKGNNWGSRPGMFQGRLDGLNHVIQNINITNKNNESYSTDVGLIGSNAGIVENLGVVNGTVNLSSKSWVGGIVGANKACGIIRNVFFSGLVEGSSNVGGIAGAQDVKTTQDGVPLPGGIIEKAYVSGTVRSNKGSNVGGIAGSNASGASISEAYNSANVRIITGGNYTGGIAGTNSGTIINAYNTGTIEGGTYVGGIAGSNSSNGSIQNTYNTGTVSGTSNEGGIVGYNSGTAPIISSFFTQGNNNGKGTQINDDELKEFATFAGTGLASNMSKEGGSGKVWRIYEGQTGPLLTAFLKTKDVVTATDYNGSEQTFDNTLAQGAANHIYATESGNLVKGTDAGKYLGNNTDPNNDTGYKVYYSDQGGYDIGDTILVIQPKKLSIADVSKVYDGNQNVISEISINGNVGNDEVNLDGNKVTGVYEDKNAGADKTVTYTVNTGALTGTDANNYTIASIVTGSGTITAKELSLVHANKVYDGTTDVEASDIVLATDIIENDNVVFDSSKVTGVYEDKNVNASGSKVVTYTISSGALTGTDAGNYSIGTAGTGDITKANVTLTVEDVVKTYDGTTEVTGKTLMVKPGSGTIFASDSLSGGTFAFTDKNVGTGNKEVTVTGGTITDVTSGADTSGNYSITYEKNTTSTINKADVTLTVEDVTKTYDGTTTVTGKTLMVKPGSGTIFVSDSLSGGTFAFADKNVGTGNKKVTVAGGTITDTTSGADTSGNYNITYEDNTTSTINKKALTATFADISKTYDGTTNATPGAGTLTGVVAVDAGKVSVSASAAYDEKNAGNRTVNYTGVTLSGEEAGNYSIATTATGNGTISRKALELVADHVSTQYGDYIPATFTGSVTGFVAGEGIGSGDTLLFALSDPSASAVGSYGVTGTINGSASGNYGLNYTFSNAASNANAFEITARPASVQDMVLSDIIPGIKGMDGANISVKALDNAMAQAAPNVKEAGIEFAIAQTILPVDAVRSMSLENNGMKQPSAMTAQEVAEQVSAQQGNGGLPAAQVDGQQGEGGLPAAQVNDTAGTPGAQVNGNVGITGNEGATGATGNGTSPAGVNENGVASNAGDTGSLNAALDMVQQTDDAVGTEESKKKKGAA